MPELTPEQRKRRTKVLRLERALAAVRKDQMEFMQSHASAHECNWLFIQRIQELEHEIRMTKEEGLDGKHGTSVQTIQK